MRWETGRQSSNVEDRRGSRITRSVEEQQLAEFVAVVLTDTEDTWQQEKLGDSMGSEYRRGTDRFEIIQQAM